mgnify:FL=1
MTRLAAALIASLTLAFFTPAVMGQGMPLVCQPHSKIKAYLTDKQQEVLIAHGLAGSALFELYANREGQWTVVIMRPDMAPIACIQGAGSDFALTGNEFPPPKADPA